MAEHHANIVSWQMVCAATGATLKHVALTATQELDLDDLAQKVTNNTKMVALVHVSNVLGSVLPAAAAAEIAHGAGALLLLDCCQSVPHMPVDVQVRALCGVLFVFCVVCVRACLPSRSFWVVDHNVTARAALGSTTVGLLTHWAASSSGRRLLHNGVSPALL